MQPAIVIIFTAIFSAPLAALPTGKHPRPTTTTPLPPRWTLPPVHTIPPPPPPPLPLPLPPRPPLPELPVLENTGKLILPSGAELVVGSIDDRFSCAGLIYGYYADPANDCRIFHVCVPSPTGIGNIRVRPPLMYSFFCGNQTVFDQARLVCSTVDSATPCDQAPNHYSVNEKFGMNDVPAVLDPRLADIR